MSARAEPTETEPPAPPGDPVREADLGTPWRKILLLALGAGALLGIVYLSPIRHYLEHWHELSQQVRSLGMLAPFAATLGVAILVAVGFPRLLFCVLAGMTFGFWWGLLWAQLGTLLGNFATYTVARRGGRDWARRYVARRGRLRHIVHQEGIPGVILARQLPVPSMLVNLACGLFAVRPRDFFVGTILGQLPEAVPCTLIGAGALQASFSRALGIISLAVGAAVVAWMVLRRWNTLFPPRPHSGR